MSDPEVQSEVKVESQCIKADEDAAWVSLRVKQQVIPNCGAAPVLDWDPFELSHALTPIRMGA